MMMALVEWAVRATLLVGIAGALLWLFRIRDVHVRLTVWTTVLVCVLLMPGVGRFLPPVTFTVSERGPVAQAVETTASAPTVIEGPNGTEPGTGTARDTAADIAVGLWLSAALFLLMRLLIGLRLSIRLARESSVVGDRIRESERVCVPITVGLVRPVIILPADWRTWSARKLQAVLEHERSHAKRFDPLRQLLASIYCGICWFHPLAWWLKAELNNLAEAASDDVALAAAEDRIEYAEMLLVFFGSAGRIPFQGAAMASRRTRARRIDRVLDGSRRLTRPLRLPARAVLVLSALALAFITAAAHPVGQVKTPAPQPVPATAGPGVKVKATARPALCGGNRAYRKWLNEDAAYIITEKERREFAALRTEHACSAFIERFWHSRNKKEHYRRIAYANDRFASGVPGWKTDRGRVYILYGPPDEIESHLEAEQWRYRQGVTMEFVDKGNGDYRLSNTPGATFGPPQRLAVSVNPDRTVSITLPVSPVGGEMHIYGRIVSQTRRVVTVFEDTARGATGLYTKSIARPLEPGSYRLGVVIKRQGDSEVTQEELAFEVK